MCCEMSDGPTAQIPYSVCHDRWMDQPGTQRNFTVAVGISPSRSGKRLGKRLWLKTAPDVHLAGEAVHPVRQSKWSSCLTVGLSVVSA